ncbi:transposase [Micromonospora sp. 050-3]|uniref:transposase n=1 Tax=Micromonospora sp. 050-3 TaxID=2789265 RepID=UPI00397AE683
MAEAFRRAADATVIYRGFTDDGGGVVRLWKLNTHVSHRMHALIAARPWLTVIRLPAYAPGLNPTEGVWRWMKRGLTNTAARGVNHLAQLVKRRLRACQQQTDLLAGFLASTGMTLEPEPPR